MAANARRGEISARIDGVERLLCLTLGALADLENAFGADDLGTLGERFATGKFSARDLIKIVAAGLRGGGASVSDDDVAAMKTENGIAGFASIVAQLLQVTFCGEESQRSDP